MKAYVFYTSISGAQMLASGDFNGACMQAEQLITCFKHSHAYVYDTADKTWYKFIPGVRGRAFECDCTEAEVPKVYRFLLMLEG